MLLGPKISEDHLALWDVRFTRLDRSQLVFLFGSLHRSSESTWAASNSFQQLPMPNRKNTWDQTQVLHDCLAVSAIGRMAKFLVTNDITHLGGISSSRDHGLGFLDLGSENMSHQTLQKIDPIRVIVCHFWSHWLLSQQAAKIFKLVEQPLAPLHSSWPSVWQPPLLLLGLLCGPKTRLFPEDLTRFFYIFPLLFPSRAQQFGVPFGPPLFLLAKQLGFAIKAILHYLTARLVADDGCREQDFCMSYTFFWFCSRFL